MSDDDRQQTYQEFSDAVNMTRKELEDWLGTDEAQSAGQSDDGGESKGHASGRHIVEILDKKKADLTDADYSHMEKVNGYVARHLKQRPDKSDEELAGMKWTYSLRNWGHDPLK